MKINNVLPIILISFVLVGCGTTPETPSVRIITATSYPVLPSIEPLPPISLIPWKHDMPRDLNASSVKNTTKCRKVKTKINENKPYVIEPVEEQTDRWWAKCGENPIIPISNIHIGFDIENWNIILENFYKLKERVGQYEHRLLEINNQRKKWRLDSEAERQKQNTESSTSKSTEDSNKKTLFQKLFGGKTK